MKVRHKIGMMLLAVGVLLLQTAVGVQAGGGVALGGVQLRFYNNSRFWCGVSLSFQAPTPGTFQGRPIPPHTSDTADVVYPPASYTLQCDGNGLNPVPIGNPIPIPIAQYETYKQIAPSGLISYECRLVITLHDGPWGQLSQNYTIEGKW